MKGINILFGIGLLLFAFSCCKNGVSSSAKINNEQAEYPKQIYKNNFTEAYMLNDSIFVTINYIGGGSSTKTEVYNIKRNIQLTR